jgi:dTDP-4-amino-4,6-dideoxygalactose transaminase
VYHAYAVRSPERDRLTAALKDAGIGFAAFYTTPLHLQPALRYLGYSEGDLPETERAARENLCLPLWAGIAEEQQAEVAAVLKRTAELVAS